MDSRIESIIAREVLDSSDLPTVEAELLLKSRIRTRAICPAGTSTGSNEAQELRDGAKEWYDGKGVSRAIKNINNEIQQALIGKDACQQEEIDALLCKIDNTPNKSRLGANAIVATSYVVAKAGAKVHNVPLYQYLAGDNEFCLPMPWILIISGGLHAGGNVDFQEYLIAPICAKSYRELFYITWKINRCAEQILSEELKHTLAFSSGGRLAPLFDSNEEGIELLIRAIQKAGYKPGIDVLIYIDVAASHFVNNKYYNLSSEKKQFTSLEMINYLSSLIQKYPIHVIEDGLGEEDWNGWSTLTDKIGSKVELVGDDLFVTNPDRLTKGIEKGIANAVLIKVNQIGTITEARETVNIAKNNRYRTVISARSREGAEETILPHLSIGFGVNEGKLGRPCVKNEFIRIEEEMLTKNVAYSYSWLKK